MPADPAMNSRRFIADLAPDASHADRKHFSAQVQAAESSWVISATCDHAEYRSGGEGQYQVVVCSG
jgi:hypothetical protein